MKIECIIKPTPKNPTLADLKAGEVFRPTNSRHIFIRGSNYGESCLLSKIGDNIWKYTTLVGSEPFEDQETFDESCDCNELIICTHLSSGGVILFYKDIEVKKVDCKLLVEEN